MCGIICTPVLDARAPKMCLDKQIFDEFLIGIVSPTLPQSFQHVLVHLSSMKTTLALALALVIAATAATAQESRFLVSVNQWTSISEGQKIPWNLVLVDVGHDFNRGLSQFTAPSDGEYRSADTLCITESNSIFFVCVKIFTLFIQNQ